MPVILYIGAALPSLSETFVYREIDALRRHGIAVQPVSVHPPQTDLSDEAAEMVLHDVIELYGPGPLCLVRDAFVELLRRPGRALRTIGESVKDAFAGKSPSLTARLKGLWQCLAALALSYRTRGLDVSRVHAHMANVPTTIAMYYAKLRGIPFSFTGHAADLFIAPALLKEKLEQAAFVACISEWHRSFYRTISPVADSKLPLVRCGVDANQFHTITQRELSASIRILAVGRLVPKKGFDTLIESIALLRNHGQEISVQIVGGGPQEHRLTELIKDQGLERRVQLIGPRTNEFVRDLMTRADIFVLPCRIDERGDRDGIPVALMEAMACGLCAVSGDLPTIRELIENDVNGLLVEPDNPTALAEVLDRLIADPAQRRRLGARGRESVIAEFSLDLNIRRLIEAFGMSEKVPAGTNISSDHV